jgi:uncharacterized membrane protein
MAYCTQCGTGINPGVAFCPNCGLATNGATPPPPPQYQQPPQHQGYAGASPTSGLDENVAGLLCYIGLWVTGIVFLLIDKRPFVRFHAAQSIVVFGGLTLARIILGIAFSGSWYYGLGGLYWLLYSLLGVVAFIAWIVLMLQAYQGRKFEIPVVADIAKNLTGKV